MLGWVEGRSVAFFSVIEEHQNVMAVTDALLNFWQDNKRVNAKEGHNTDQRFPKVP
jgi:hypothetical protein